MRLIIKRDGNNFTEFELTEGLAHIGRQTSSEIHLPDVTVSRKHASISKTDNGTWVIEDLGSANKTYLNDEMIQKAELKDGDILRIGEFELEIQIRPHSSEEPKENLADTIAPTVHDFKRIIRRLDTPDAPPLRWPAGRILDFSRTVESMHSVNTTEAILLALLDAILRDLNAFHVWGALRSTPQGPMLCHGGKDNEGNSVDLETLSLADRINEAIDKSEYYLFPNVTAVVADKNIRSALVVPVLASTGCFGILYADNARGEPHYSISELDYIMMLALQAAAEVQRL